MACVMAYDPDGYPDGYPDGWQGGEEPAAGERDGLLMGGPSGGLPAGSVDSTAATPLPGRQPPIRPLRQRARSAERRAERAMPLPPRRATVGGGGGATGRSRGAATRVAGEVAEVEREMSDFTLELDALITNLTSTAQRGHAYKR